jgi:hypothetical protein
MSSTAALKNWDSSGSRSNSEEAGIPTSPKIVYHSASVDVPAVTVEVTPGSPSTPSERGSPADEKLKNILKL